MIADKTGVPVRVRPLLLGVELVRGYTESMEPEGPDERKKPLSDHIDYSRRESAFPQADTEFFEPSRPREAFRFTPRISTQLASL